MFDDNEIDFILKNQSEEFFIDIEEYFNLNKTWFTQRVQKINLDNFSKDYRPAKEDIDFHFMFDNKNKTHFLILNKKTSRPIYLEKL